MLHISVHSRRSNMYTSNTCLVLLFIVLGADATSIRRNGIWSDCTNPSSPLRITSLNMEPNPVTLPGALFYSMQGYSNRSVGSSRMELDIERVGSWFNIPIPCLFNIGSCTYPDMCTMLDQMINENWLNVTQLIGQDIKNMVLRNGMNPGLCPQPPAQLSISRTRLRLPELPTALYWFAEGLYHANVRVIETSSEVELICMDINLNVKQQESECSGWFGCMFS